MEQPYNFTFFVHDKLNGIKWACSKKALEIVEELRIELKDFSLHNGSVIKGIERFIEGGGKLKNGHYELEIDKIFYENGKRPMRLEEYVKELVG